MLEVAFVSLTLASGALPPPMPGDVGTSAPRRFEGLERLYFERLTDPAAAGGGVAEYLAEPLGRLLPDRLESGEGPEPEPRVVTDLAGPTHFGLELRDFVFPNAQGGGFLRQVVDATHPRLHSQYWAIYTGSERSDLHFFATFDPDRRVESGGGVKVLAPLELHEMRDRGDGTWILRVSGTVFRPQGAGWMYGTDLVFALAHGELRLLHVIRRYSLNFGYDLGEGRTARVAVEEVGIEDGAKVLVRRIYDGELPANRTGECGFDLLDGFPKGDFDELLELASCVAEWPESETVRRPLDSPSFLERGWRPPSPPREPASDDPTG